MRATVASQRRPARPGRPRRGRRALAGVCLAWLLLACNGAADSNESASLRTDGWITIRGTRVALEVVRTRAEMTRGLGGRDALPWGRGMLFLYEEPGFPGFWMKDMRFDIDIVWIRGHEIVDISHRVPHVPGGTGPTLVPRALTDTVLEVPAGFAEANGWRVGSRTALELGEP